MAAQLILTACVAVLLAVGAPCLSAQTAPTAAAGNLPAQPAAPARPNATPAGYRLHLSDTLQVSFPFSPDYNQTVAVQPDGTIALREAQPVKAQGATLGELEQRIAGAYRGILRDPVVSVSLNDFQKPSFYASGEVGRPGRFELRVHTTLIQALSEAGGISPEFGKRSKIIIYRPRPDSTYETTVVNVKQYAKAKGPFEDFLIHPGDVIYVPQNTFSKVSRFVPTPSLGAYAY